MKIGGTMMNHVYQVFLIPATGGPIERLTNAHACPDQSADFGSDVAARRFPGIAVEVVVFHVLTREAVRNIMIGQNK